ncbi:hypothetical protein DFH11DRAFT_1729471 [Phellopilus nigrolimitatus]|nr:hypothetical protein DFH11DRAFT_1729471 [Phellopilus nigrolimitatus]
MPDLTLELAAGLGADGVIVEGLKTWAWPSIQASARACSRVPTMRKPMFSEAASVREHGVFGDLRVLEGQEGSVLHLRSRVHNLHVRVALHEAALYAVFIPLAIGIDVPAAQPALREFLVRIPSNPILGSSICEAHPRPRDA